MKRCLAYVGVIAGALMATAALAQSAGGADQNAAPQAAKPSQTGQAEPGAPAAKRGDIVTQQAQDEWRVTKLVGVGVYDADNKRIGAIKEVLMGHDGSAKSVVIGVGFPRNGHEGHCCPLLGPAMEDREPPGSCR